jgi:hypothetical protein
VHHQVTTLDNGTAEQQRFGDLTAFEHLDRHAAAMLNPLMCHHPRGLLIAIDQPFAGLGPLLSAAPGWRLLYQPRSSADHHADPERATWEQHGLDGWTALGAAFGAISTHMRTLLTGKGVPPEQIIDVPGGLTAADQYHLHRRMAALRLPATLWTRFDPGLPGLLHHPALRAVVVPSRVEPLGRISLEAFAAGAAPVVATTAGGLAETVIDGSTGYCATPGDPPSLARAISRALTASPAEIARLRQGGKHLVAGRDYTH